ncbi:mucin-7 [Cynocephalus volans]|uniref:mucin-7 n=1 Tax=Cynocephalus volans TaxID=110931 RepID=UPI002FCCB1F8
MDQRVAPTHSQRRPAMEFQQQPTLFSEGQRKKHGLQHRRNHPHRSQLHYKLPHRFELPPPQNPFAKKFFHVDPRKPYRHKLTHSPIKSPKYPQYPRPHKFPVKNNTVVSNNTSGAVTQAPSVNPTFALAHNATTTPARGNDVPTGSSVPPLKTTAAPPAPSPAPSETPAAPPSSSPDPPETTAAPPSSSPDPPETTAAPPSSSPDPLETTAAPPSSSPDPPETTAAPPSSSPDALETTAAPITTPDSSPTTLAPETTDTPTTQAANPQQETSSSEEEISQLFLRLKDLLNLIFYYIVR